MAAVSLSDAWNEPPDIPPPPMAGNTRQVSAKAASIAQATPNDDEEDTIPAAAPLIVETNERVESLLHEIRLLRIEESRRCTVYLAVGGVLFSILFMYIDRLQRQLRLFVGGMVVPSSEPVYSGTYHPPNNLPGYTPVVRVPPGTPFRALRRW